MRQLLLVLGAAVMLLAAIQVQGQRELAGAFIAGSDLCPPSVKQAPAAPQPAQPQRAGSSLSRIFSPRRSSSAPAAMTTTEAGPACRTAYKYCGDVLAVAKRCKETFGCRAFTYDGRCGYLKSQEGPRTKRQGWSTYIVG